MSETRSSLERLARFDIRPNRELGQNFLVDDNILGVIERAAELDGADVVLEVGGGLGVLSSFLAARVGHLHVVEMDARLEPVLIEALAGRPSASLYMGDFMHLPASELDPVPNKVVANLPYGVAVPAILKTIEDLPGVGLWCVMLQREIADRLGAIPGTKAYGIPSVLVQLACEVKLLRAISRRVFFPVPNVDSALVRLLRRGEGAPPGVRSLVRAGFAHRRKGLARSLELAGERLTPGTGAASLGLRARVRDALVQMGHPPGERAERLAPEEFGELARMIGWEA